MPPRFIKLKVQAGARENALTIQAPDSFVVRVKAPAEGGKANAAALAMLADHLSVPAGKLWIVKGAHAPAKIVAVRS